MPRLRSDAAKVAAMLRALDRGEDVESAARHGAPVDLATAYRWRQRAEAGEPRTLAALAAVGYAPPTWRAPHLAPVALPQPGSAAPPATPPNEEEGDGALLDAFGPDGDVTLVTHTATGRRLLAIVHGSAHTALALALGAKGAAGDDNAGALVELLEAARMVAKGSSEAERWADPVFVRWIALGETLFPGLVEQLKRGARTCKPGEANGVNFEGAEAPPRDPPRRRPRRASAAA